MIKNRTLLAMVPGEEPGWITWAEARKRFPHLQPQRVNHWRRSDSNCATRINALDGKTLLYCADDLAKMEQARKNGRPDKVVPATVRKVPRVAKPEVPPAVPKLDAAPAPQPMDDAPLLPRKIALSEAAQAVLAAVGRNPAPGEVKIPAQTVISLIELHHSRAISSVTLMRAFVDTFERAAERFAAENGQEG